MNILTVREPISDDEPELAEVERLATADLRKVYRPTPLALKRRSAIDSNLQRLAAVLEGRVVGTVQYRIVADRLSLLGLAVHPEFRRLGVATALVQHLERIGLDYGCKAVALHTVRETGNVAIFERMGFKVESQRATDLFEERDDFNTLRSSHAEESCFRSKHGVGAVRCFGSQKTLASRAVERRPSGGRCNMRSLS